MTLASLCLLAAMPLAMALPSVQPRACTKITPSSIYWVNQDAPDYDTPGNEFHISHLTTPGYDSFSIVTFTDIPEGATGCMLEMEIPVLVEPEVIANGPGTQLDVYTITPDNPTAVSWNNQDFTRETKVAETIPFPTGTTTSEFQTVLYSDSCRPAMSFLFQQSAYESNEYGEVGFANEESLVYIQGKDTGPVGFYMVYNC